MGLSASDRLFRERVSGEYSATITDPSEAAIPLSKVDTLVLTLVDLDSDTVINSRDNQDVLNANDVTYNEQGELVWTIRPADNAIVGDVCAGKAQRHLATFELTWTDGGDSFEKNWSLELGVIAVESVE